MLCKKAEAAFPGSYGAALCTSLRSRITEKSMQFQTEFVNVPDKPFKAVLQYKNISKVYLRMVPIGLEAWQKLTGRYYTSDTLALALVKMPHIKQWDIVVPDGGDFQNHSVEFSIPAAPCGHYLIIAASNPSFLAVKEALCYGTTQISNISFINRNGKNGDPEFFLLDRTRGTALAGVTAKAWIQEYDQHARDYKKILAGTYTSDAAGHISMPLQSKRYQAVTVDFTLGKDRLRFEQRGTPPRALRFSQPALF